MFKAKLAAFVDVVFDKGIPIEIRYLEDSEIANPEIHLGMIVNVGSFERILLCEDDLFKIHAIHGVGTGQTRYASDPITTLSDVYEYCKISVDVIADPEAKKLLQSLLKVSGF